jgi:uncharacterized protein
MKDRSVALDALRGFALVGIILGNVTWFSGYAVASPAQRLALGTAAFDRPIELILHMLVDGKFYGLFSLMFGAGFALMVGGAEARGLPVARVVARRLTALLAIGLAHATLLWFGDIVSLYAVSAVPLYWMRRWSTRRLAVAAGVCLIAPVLLSAIILVAAVVTGDTGHGDLGHGPAALLPAFAAGRYPEVLPANWAFLFERWELALLSGRPIRLLGMFILGMCAVRLRRPPPSRTVCVLVVTALIGNVVLALLADAPARPPSLLGLSRDLVQAIAIPTGSVAYAAVLWPRFSARGPITRALAAAGRLSLSHYLTQSLVLSALFYGYGLGLWGRVGIAWAVCIALAIAALQTLCSPLWLRRLGPGPAERMLRG